VSLLEVKNLNIDVGERRVVHGASFTLEAGEKLALVVESASGITVTALTTLRLIETAKL
jgi:microcin C transport system ATP-binding protein